MKPQTEDRFLAKVQRRKDLLTGRIYPPNSAQSPLNAGPLDFAPLHFCARTLLLLLLLLLLMTASTMPVTAQEVVDTIRIETRVVFMDALVKDKKTGIPISDLKPENFEIFDNGQPRSISYFGREGQTRKPLALVIILDLRSDGAGRFLKRPEILKAMIDELSRLSPEDEVAIMAMDINEEDEKRLWLTGFTRDPNQIAAALSKVPEFIGELEEGNSSSSNEATKDKAEKKEAKPVAEATKTEESVQSKEVAAEAHQSTASQTAALQEATQNQVVEVETIKGKSGAVVTRTMNKDGTVDIKRVSKDGKVTIQIEDIYDMAAAVRDASRRAQEQRPNSQASIVWISDGIAPIFFEDRDATLELLTRNNVIFNSLTVELRTLFKVLLPIGKPIAGWMGVSLYGSAKTLAQKTGGEAMKVNRTKDYGTGLGKIIGNLTARYSLGFTFAEDEQDDGLLHNLEVKVKAPDAKGKLRKLQVSSRQGYYMSTSTVGPREATATTVK